MIALCVNICAVKTRNRRLHKLGCKWREWRNSGHERLRSVGGVLREGSDIQNSYRGLTAAVACYYYARSGNAPFLSFYMKLYSQKNDIQQ